MFYRLSLFAASIALSTICASAQTPKELRILVGYASGGGYDAYARVVAQHLGKHLRGAPAVIVQNMPGADGLTVANYMFTVPAKDGSVIALTNRNIAVAPTLGLIEAKNVRYKAEQFYWIANLNAEVSAIVARSDAGITSIEDLKKRSLLVGSTGLTSNNAIYPYVTNNLIGTKMKVVAGYPGTSHLVLALERGEIAGIGGWAWSSIAVQKPTWISDKFIIPLMQLGLEKHPDLRDVPMITDFAKSEEDKLALRLIFAPEAMGRPFFGPPGMDPTAGEALREAFGNMVADPEFVATSTKAKLEVTFLNGKSLQTLVADLTRVTPGAIARAKQLTERGQTEVDEVRK
jgi:tripartite-type tricarboxylate transporter receptor subunit TctC